MIIVITLASKRDYKILFICFQADVDIFEVHDIGENYIELLFTAKEAIKLTLNVCTAEPFRFPAID